MLALSKFNLINKSGLKQGYDEPAFPYVYWKDEESKSKTKKPAVVIKLL